MIPLELLGFLHLGIVDVLDIVVVAIVIYVVFRWLKGSSAMNILIAILALLAIRFVASAMNMKLLSTLLDAVINVGAIALIVIFQPEIRQFLSRLGRRRGGWLDRLLGRKGEDLGAQASKEIVQACRDMAESRTGALIVILHKNALEDVIESGDRIDADIRSRLIENIFVKDSPLHDGAIIIGGGRIIAARCTLPITERKDLPAKYGMRHKSAVGLTERSDADVIVVSEQRGTISFVRDGEIFPIAGMNELKLKLEPQKEKE
ncbi:MAG: diadenylate cyclase CdaA [Bacteroidales bacterium]|nr:diadenylate cyclase CdaA [Bacteroidales bacterium]